jgi:hypothetical protein
MTLLDVCELMGKQLLACRRLCVLSSVEEDVAADRKCARIDCLSEFSCGLIFVNAYVCERRPEA